MAKLSLQRALYDTLSQRVNPAKVADMINVGLPDDAFTPAERRTFPKLPQWYRSAHSSYMSEKWESTPGLDKQVALLAKLVDGIEPPADGSDAALIVALADHVGYAYLGVPMGRMAQGPLDYKKDRLPRARRRIEIPLVEARAMSRRRYDKLFRIVARLHVEAVDMARQQRLNRLSRMAKVGFAADVPYAAFKSTPYVAAFVAYMHANLARRSLFTISKQARAFDAAAEMLFRHIEADPNTTEAGWFAVAHVFARDDVLARVSLEHRVALLEKARAMLSETATLLEATMLKSGESLNLTSMVVRRGADSSTWNALAGAWNKARDLWIATAWRIDPEITEHVLPGKVLRLMAADVAAWHRRSGGGLDPDTKVWGMLPRPWDVLAGRAECSRAIIAAACIEAGVDPDKSGWAKPRPRSAVDTVRETPETVHGVIVGHPELARLLKQAGWFAGASKNFRADGTSRVLAVPAVEVERDEHGAALSADWPEAAEAVS